MLGLKKKNQQPLLSVLIPVYNAAEYLDQCLASVSRQTYPHLEIILVDDGSTDASRTIYLAYAQKDRRIKIIEQQNAGPGAARNTALRQAAGEYIHFIDSDDYLGAADHYEKMLKALLQTGADIACCGFYKNAELVSEFKRQILLKNRDMDLRMSLAIICPCAWRYIYKREFLAKHLLFFDGRIKYSGEDVPFSLMAMYYARRIVLVPAAGYVYRRYPGSLTNLPDSDRQRELQRQNDFAWRVVDEFSRRHNFRQVFDREVFTYKLFGCLPLLRRERYNNNTERYYLFGKIPLWTKQDLLSIGRKYRGPYNIAIY